MMAGRAETNTPKLLRCIADAYITFYSNTLPRRSATDKLRSFKLMTEVCALSTLVCTGHGLTVPLLVTHSARHSIVVGIATALVTDSFRLRAPPIRKAPNRCPTATRSNSLSPHLQCRQPAHCHLSPHHGTCPPSPTGFPVHDAGYFVWMHRMRRALAYCRLLDIVVGTLKESADPTQRVVWLKMDATGSALIMGCITVELVVKMAGLTTANAAWEYLVAEFGQGADSMYWCSRLTRHTESGGDVSAHLDAYQEALEHLAHADLAIPDWLTSALFLSPLPGPGRVVSRCQRDSD